jgi:uncharacterized protein YdeI (YjbR/CyaY-like superfamily)
LIAVSQRYGQLQVESRAQWRAWLAEHAADTPGIWLITYKKSSGGPYVSYDDVVEEALCFGWVDSKGLGLDAERSQLLMTPRKAGSGWSRPNQQRIAKLTEAGLMTPAGNAVVERAKADGSWTALDDAWNLIEPGELRAALDADGEARRQWNAFPPSAKRAILEWIGAAKRPATREKRIAETARLAAKGERANEWRPR